MSYKVPTGRRRKKDGEPINLIPILDAVFIIIFFLLMSSQFLKIHEIGSNVPIISNSPPPKNIKPRWALTLTIKKNEIVVSKGVPSRTYKRVKKTSDGQYDLNQLHSILVQIKKKNVNEEDITLEPVVDLKYEEIVKIMDAVRLLNNTDDTIFKKDKDGIDTELKTLFSKIVFGNLMS